MKINETRKRSLLKGLTQRVIEVAVDTLILSFFETPHVAFGLAIVIELICWGTHYVNERCWNKSDYGRYVK